MDEPAPDDHEELSTALDSEGAPAAQGRHSEGGRTTHCSDPVPSGDVEAGDAPTAPPSAVPEHDQQDLFPSMSATVVDPASSSGERRSPPEPTSDADTPCEEAAPVAALSTAVGTGAVVALPTHLPALPGDTARPGPTVPDTRWSATRISTAREPVHDSAGSTAAFGSMDVPPAPPVHPLPLAPAPGPHVPVGPVAGASVGGYVGTAGQDDEGGDDLMVVDADLAGALAQTASRVASGVVAEVPGDSRPGHRPG